MMTGDLLSASPESFFTITTLFTLAIGAFLAMESCTVTFLHSKRLVIPSRSFSITMLVEHFFLVLYSLLEAWRFPLITIGNGNLLSLTLLRAFSVFPGISYFVLHLLKNAFAQRLLVMFKFHLEKF